MRWGLALLGLLVCAGPSLAATSHGVGGSCNFVLSNTCNITINGVMEGSAIIVSSSTDGTHSTLVANDGVNTYANSLVTGANPSQGTIVACNVTAGNYTITVTLSDVRFGTARAREVKGAERSSSCLGSRVSNGQTGVGIATDAITSTTIGTPASAGSYIYGVTVKNCCTFLTITEGTGFTLDIAGNDNGALSKSEYLIQGAPASATATFTASVAGTNFQTHGLIIKPDVSGVLGVGASVDNTCNASSCTTAGVTSTAGSAFMVWVSHFATCTINTVTDSKSNEYVPLGSVRAVDGGIALVEQFYSTTGNGGTGHSFSVGLAPSCVASIYAVEITGSNLAIDNHGSGGDDVSPYTSPALTTSRANTLLVGFIAEGSGTGTCTHTHGNSFIQLTEESNCATQWTGATSYRLVSATGTYNTSVTVTGTFNGTANYIIAWYEGLSGGSTVRFFGRRILQ